MTTQETHSWYVCTNYNTTWMGCVEDMLEDYNYPSSSTSYFNTYEEACMEYNFRLEAEAFISTIHEVSGRGEVFIPRPDNWVVPAVIWTAWLSSPETVHVVAIPRGGNVDNRFRTIMSRPEFEKLGL